MKTFNKRIISSIMLMFFILSVMSMSIVPSRAQAAMSLDELAVKAVQNNYDQRENLGAYDLYILLKAGANLDSWQVNDKNLSELGLEAINDTIANTDAKVIDDWSGKEVYAHKSKAIAAQYLLAKKLGKTDKAASLMQILGLRQTASGNGAIDNNAFGDIAAFELLGRSGDIEQIDTDRAIDYILANKADSGAWTSGYADITCSAEGVRALKYLKPYAAERADEVQNAIDEGLSWLKARQQENGSFQDDSGYDDPLIDTAELIYTLKLLNIEPASITSSAGKSPLDYIINEALNEDGTFGTYGSVMDNSWALDALLQLGAKAEEDALINLSLEPLNAIVYRNAKQQYSSQALVLNGTVTDVSSLSEWSSDNGAIAVINASGVLSGQKAGKSVVNAVYNGVKASTPVTVELNKADKLAAKAVQNNYEQRETLGAYDLYILLKAGANLDVWQVNDKNLSELGLEAINDTIANPDAKTTDSYGKEVYAHKSKAIAAQYLLAKKLGKIDKAASLMQTLGQRQTASGKGAFDNNAFGDIAAFEFLGRSGDIEQIDTAGAVDYILANKAANGAWTSGWADITCTAEAVRALKYLKPYAAERADEVQNAIDEGLSWLKARQQENGSFQDDGGYDDPLVDSAELIYTLNLLGIDPTSITSSTGKNPVDYILDEVSNENGSFGRYGTLMDNTWMLDALLQLDAIVYDDTVLYINIEPESAELVVNETQQFNAQAYSLDGSSENINSKAEWSVEDDAIASIDENGLVTAIKDGNTTVKLSYCGISQTAVLTVNANGSSGGGPVIEKVYIAVVGDKENGILVNKESVKLNEDDSTVLDVLESKLDEKNIDYQIDDGNYVRSIAGLAHKKPGYPGSGWKYKVIDGVSSSTIPSDSYKVKSGDRIIWWYALDIESKGPDWNNLGKEWKKEHSGTGSDKIDSDVNEYSNELADLQDENIIMNQKSIMKADKAAKLKEELDKNVVSMSKSCKQNSSALLSDDEISLQLPKKALTKNTKITVKEITDKEPSNNLQIRLASSVYEFGPSGTKFNKELSISIRLPISDDMNTESLSPAWYDEEKEKWIKIPAVIDLKEGIVVFKINHFTKFAVIEQIEKVSFDDMGEDMSWAIEAVESLAAKGIIQGSGQGFEPGRMISRAEFIKLLVKAKGIAMNEYNNGIFTDVKSSDWFAPAVAAAYENELINGYPDGSFRPGDAVSRNEIAVMISKMDQVLDTDMNNVDLTFSDSDKIPDWASTGVKYLYQQGLITGYEDGTFKGDRSLSRAEAAVIIYRYLN